MKNAQQCETLINQWLQDYQQLKEIITSEQQALEKRDFEGLTHTIEKKNRIVEIINQHKIPTLIDENGVSINTRVELKAYCMSNKLLKKAWTNLIQLIENCRFKNEVSARLIDLLSQSCTRTFNLLKGFDPDNNIYNAAGNRTAIRHRSESLLA